MNIDTFIKEIARKAGEATLKRFRKDGAIYMKSEYAFDVVTKADLMADKLIVSAIKKRFPTHGITAEESGTVRTESDYIWYVDPIDGTKNFAKHIPLFGTMIALAHKGELILSAVYIPASKELFFAKKGKGAFLNGKRIRCSPVKNLLKSDGFCQLQLMSRNRTFVKNILALKKTDHFAFATYNCFAVNGCYAAAGRKDWVVAPYGQIHDFAAPALILKESGCTITDFSGKPWTLHNKGIVAANPILHKQLIKLSKGV
jgi:myo-inositol-1(or 4)-monophosphatase